jgi:hypothetical protein
MINCRVKQKLQTATDKEHFVLKKDASGEIIDYIIIVLLGRDHDTAG